MPASSRHVSRDSRRGGATCVKGLATGHRANVTRRATGSARRREICAAQIPRLNYTPARPASRQEHRRRQDFVAQPALAPPLKSQLSSRAPVCCATCGLDARCLSESELPDGAGIREAGKKRVNSDMLASEYRWMHLHVADVAAPVGGR